MSGRFSKFRLLFVVAITSIASLGTVAVHAQDFLAYEGKNAIREGDGGAKKVVSGIDFWSDGAPPRRYQVLGFISDRRHKSGLVGMVSMSNLEGDIASLAKQHGGDAVILMQSEAETVGTVGVANAHATGNSAFGFGMARGIQKQNTRFTVIKYVNDALSPGAVTSPAAAAPGAASTPGTPGFAGSSPAPSQATQ